MLVEVSQADIDAGDRRGLRDCPLALALTRAIGKSVGVYSDTALVPIGRRPVWLRLPVEAQQFRIDFDAGRPVKPFAFELAMPEVAHA